MGVAGLFLKDNPLEDLVEAIRKVGAGESWFDPKYVKALLRPSEAELEPVSSREKMMARCLMEGKSNKEIAQELGTSEGWVKGAWQGYTKKPVCEPGQSWCGCRWSESGGNASKLKKDCE